MSDTPTTPSGELVIRTPAMPADANGNDDIDENCRMQPVHR